MNQSVGRLVLATFCLVIAACAKPGKVAPAITSADAARAKVVPRALHSGEAVPCGQIATDVPLNVGESITSCNGQFRLIMQGDGNLVIYNVALQIPLWAPMTQAVGQTRMIMQGDGNLVIYDQANHPLFHTGTWGNPGAWLLLQDDGNLVVRTAAGVPLFVTNSWGNLRIPCTGMTANMALHEGERFMACDGRNWFALSGGNVILYNNGVTINYTTSGLVATLVMQGDGNLVAYTAAGQPAWHSHTYMYPGATLVLPGPTPIIVYNGAVVATPKPGVATTPAAVSTNYRDVVYFGDSGETLQTYDLNVQIQGEEPFDIVSVTGDYNRFRAKQIIYSQGNRYVTIIGNFLPSAVQRQSLSIHVTVHGGWSGSTSTLDTAPVLVDAVPVNRIRLYRYSYGPQFYFDFNDRADLHPGGTLNGQTFSVLDRAVSTNSLDCHGMLYQCRITNTNAYFLSNQANCEGHTFDKTLGVLCGADQALYNTSASMAPIRRMYQPATFAHLTAGLAEIDNALAHPSWGWVGEGTQGFGFNP